MRTDLYPYQEDASEPWWFFLPTHKSLQLLVALEEHMSLTLTRRLPYQETYGLLLSGSTTSFRAYFHPELCPIPHLATYGDDQPVYRTTSTGRMAHNLAPMPERMLLLHPNVAIASAFPEWLMHSTSEFDKVTHQKRPSRRLTVHCIACRRTCFLSSLLVVR